MTNQQETNMTSSKSYPKTETMNEETKSTKKKKKNTPIWLALA